MACRVILAGLFALVPALATAAEYVIAPERSEFVVKLYKAGLASALAHDHVVRATRFAGRVAGDPSNPTSASVEVTVQAGSLQADEPELRRKYGLTKALSESDRLEIQSTMLSERQLDAAKHPTITFRSTSLRRQADGGLLLTGDFTLHGVTKRVSFPITGQLSGDTLRATGSFDFNQTDFNIKPYSAFLGAVRNQDRVTLLFEVTAVRR